MKVTEITTLAQGNTDTELILLEKEAENSSEDVDIYIRLSQLHRLKENYKEAWACLHKADELAKRGSINA
jgi:hypothetical protein